MIISVAFEEINMLQTVRYREAARAFPTAPRNSPTAFTTRAPIGTFLPIVPNHLAVSA